MFRNPINAHAFGLDSSKEGIVRDGRTAITIAHAVWSSLHPELRVDESVWQKNLVATLKDGVWKVTEPPLGRDEIGGEIWFLISQKDGRVMGIYMTQ